MNKVYIVVLENYALSEKMYIFSTKRLAEGFIEYYRKETGNKEIINIFEKEIDDVVLNENEF